MMGVAMLLAFVVNLLLGLLLLAQSAQAQVYTYIDAEGNRVFTDSPRSSTLHGSSGSSSAASALPMFSIVQRANAQSKFDWMMAKGAKINSLGDP